MATATIADRPAASTRDLIPVDPNMSDHFRLGTRVTITAAAWEVCAALPECGRMLSVLHAARHALLTSESLKRPLPMKVWAFGDSNSPNPRIVHLAVICRFAPGDEQTATIIAPHEA